MIKFILYCWLIFRSSFDYKFEEPLYNIDTEPRFLKKTFETLSGFLTHTFSSDDAKDTRSKKTEKKGLRNPLENVNPVKFPPAAVHNYKEVSHNVHYHYNKPKEVIKQNTHSETRTQQQTSSANFPNNSWKPSQRLVVNHFIFIVLDRFLVLIPYLNISDIKWLMKHSHHQQLLILWNLKSLKSLISFWQNKNTWNQSMSGHKKMSKMKRESQ